VNKKSTFSSGFLSLRALIIVLLCAAGGCSILTGSLLGFFRPEGSGKLAGRTLTFEERVSYQRAIDEVYRRHRIWPKENSNPKPSLDAVISQPQLEKKVTDYLRKSQALEDHWQRPITAKQLQAEMDRIAQHTKQPEVLEELFQALGNDPFIIAECLARPILAQRLPAQLTNEQVRHTTLKDRQIVAATDTYDLPSILDTLGGCINDTWAPTNLAGAPDGRDWHTAVWTGSEMIVWGGTRFGSNTGARYNPSTDSWTATTTINAPIARAAHTAVWTGSEMFVWGGEDSLGLLNTGGKYDPNTDSWTATSTTNSPEGRIYPTAVWTGSEMIVWGGSGEFNLLDSGGRYNPSSDSWTATSTNTAPEARSGHTAVWTGAAMIVWGGIDDFGDSLNTGGSYDPTSDSWGATETSNAPDPRTDHTSVWTGTEMIVWGGAGGQLLSNGGKYNPVTNSWTASSTTGAPSGRLGHKAIWTGSQMIVWGGDDPLNTNTGGRYCAQSGPTPTPTPCTGRCSPTPRPRPTPHLRPTPH
jgi:N-acetylneuraminic acid mutarotase